MSSPRTIYLVGGKKHGDWAVSRKLAEELAGYLARYRAYGSDRKSSVRVTEAFVTTGASWLISAPSFKGEQLEKAKARKKEARETATRARVPKAR